MSARRIVHNKPATKGKVRPHQPGQSIFKAILPEEIDWKTFPAFPPSARLAVVVGEPLQQGPYTIRVKVPRGVKLMPHSTRRTEFTQLSPALSTSAWVIASTPRSYKPIHQAP